MNEEKKVLITKVAMGVLIVISILLLWLSFKWSAPDPERQYTPVEQKKPNRTIILPNLNEGKG